MNKRLINDDAKFSNDKTKICLELTSADYCPDDLHEQLPVKIETLRNMPGLDRPDYWLAKCEVPLCWKEQGLKINYLIVACRYIGTKLRKGVGNVTIGVAYVTDESILNDKNLQFEKCVYVAVCEANEI